MTHAIYNTAVVAQDLSVHIQMASVQRVDKVLVLRSTDEANRVQINFRATADDGTYGDLMVQEVKDCVFTIYTQTGEVKLPHNIGQPIDIDADLTGTHLTIKVDEAVVFDRDVPVAVRSGKVGVGVIDHSETVFDDLVIRSHD